MTHLSNFIFSFSLIAALSLSSLGLMAQCETEFGIEEKSYFDNIARRAQLKNDRDDIVYVPIVFFIEMNAGVPVYNEANLDAVLLECNTWFASADLILETCGEPIFYEAGEGYTGINNVLRVNMPRLILGAESIMGMAPILRSTPIAADHLMRFWRMK
jgi:hypothetical protein